jgi:hypothetical protein
MFLFSPVSANPPNFTYMLLLPEQQNPEAYGPSKNQYTTLHKN